jgi:putative addiction module component (TIGR02574 family)
MTASTIVDEALALPLAERSFIVGRLLLSLDEDRPLSDEWREEIARRVARREAGESRSVSREEVRRDVQALLS